MNEYKVDRIHPSEHLLDENFQEDFPVKNNATQTLVLDESYFSIDAMIFRDIRASKIDFCHNNSRIFTFSFENFPHLGIWKQPNSPFVCLEPWAGYVDHINTNGQLHQKLGIQNLPAHSSKKYSWSVEF